MGQGNMVEKSGLLGLLGLLVVYARASAPKRAMMVATSRKTCLRVFGKQ